MCLQNVQIKLKGVIDTLPHRTKNYDIMKTGELIDIICYTSEIYYYYIVLRGNLEFLHI